MKLICSLFIISFLLCTGNSLSSQNCNVAGAWEVESVIFTDKDGAVNQIDISDPPGLKILSQSHWTFVEMTGNPSNPTSGGGGTYVVDGSTYTEYVQYHAAADYIGKTIAFDCQVVNNKWYQSGLLPDGTMLEEVYRRAR